MNDVLKKPVHAVVLRESHIQKLSREGKLPQQLYAKPSPASQPLPKEEPPKKPSLTFNAPKGPDVMKQARLRTHLRVLHDSVGPFPEDKKPPCDSCQTAACCRAFVVHITQEEYESGLYAPYAVEITDEVRRQIPPTSKNAVLLALSAPNVLLARREKFFLEGTMGEPCPFLQEDNRCGIYEVRPYTCRAYTCIGDDNITEGMRNGTEDIASAMIDRALELSVRYADK